MDLRSFGLHDAIARNALVHGARTALVFEGQRSTHAEYAARVAQLAAGLAAAGVGRGDRVAILAQNCPEYLDLFGAAASLGAILVPINWRLSAEEVAYIVGDVAPKLLVAADEFKSLLPESLEGVACYGFGGQQAPWGALQSLYAHDAGAAKAPLAPLSDDDGVVIIHTAAVGGRPRGALLSHRGLMLAAMQTQLAWGLTPKDVNLGVLPLFHVAAIGFWLAAQLAGGSTLLLTRFDPAALVRHIDADGGSLIGTFPPMLGALLDAAAAQGSALAHLRIVSGIDAPETLQRLRTVCPHARFWSAYGQTETSGWVSMAPFDECPGSAGRPAGLNRVAIVDDLDQEVPLGETGEIVVRGPMVFEGYWRLDEDNAFTFRNGWHHTGDMGRLDAEGYLWYSGRSPAKELIKPGGENVYPAEVERTLLEHPAIAEAVVIGVPDAQWGEAIKAVCVLQPGQMVSAEALIEFVGARIARYKKPKHVVFVPELPKDAAGKTDRTAVKTKHGGL
ncbi:AMP-binding protein [Extensimonas perlucida]|uniref:AMP-binding protein n=1 Tax=Extensimonas perlucida TaxID=2590786 RepID=UPI0011A80F4F|nr:AMP-binding protein [Extensimonas perlucida]